MITNERMAVNTAKRVVDFLNKKGIKATSKFKFKPIRKSLRDCWYVKKLLDTGATDCIHIHLEDCGSFLAVTNDCKLMSGMHVMIQDAIYSIFCEYVDSEWDNELFWKIPMKRYSDEWGDCGMFLIEPNDFRNWIDSLTFATD